MAPLLEGFVAPKLVHLEGLSGGTDCAAKVAGKAARDDMARLHVAFHVVAAVRDEAAMEAAVPARGRISAELRGSVLSGSIRR